MSHNQPVLIALTPEAEASMGGARLRLDSFPYRIGRESRVAIVEGEERIVERRRSRSGGTNNDLYLQDKGRVLNVSREHLQIERTEEGFQVVDRGSACGTLVGSVSVGGRDNGGECPLNSGDVIVVGTSESPFVFRFVIEE